MLSNFSHPNSAFYSQLFILNFLQFPSWSPLTWTGKHPHFFQWCTNSRVLESKDSSMSDKPGDGFDWIPIAGSMWRDFVHSEKLLRVINASLLLMTFYFFHQQFFSEKLYDKCQPVGKMAARFSAIAGLLLVWTKPEHWLNRPLQNLSSDRLSKCFLRPRQNFEVWAHFCLADPFIRTFRSFQPRSPDRGPACKNAFSRP